MEKKIPALYKGHEIATHGVKHLTLARCPMTDVVKEILEDRQALEGLTGEIVCGHAYPNGSYSPEIKTLLPSLGIHYARTATDTGLYTHPQDFYEWNPTCHHNNRLMYHAKNSYPLICHSSSIYSMSGDTAMNSTGITTGMSSKNSAK